MIWQYADLVRQKEDILNIEDETELVSLLQTAAIRQLCSPVIYLLQLKVSSMNQPVRVTFQSYTYWFAACRASKAMQS